MGDDEELNEAMVAMRVLVHEGHILRLFAWLTSELVAKREIYPLME